MTDQQKQDLIDDAAKVRANAYARYSVYPVGAAIRGANGKVYVGCNVENISYGLSLCAERSAIAAMIADGCQEIEAIAVATKNGGTPCGMCRQALAEFAPREALIICTDGEAATEHRMGDLLPAAFEDWNA